MSVLVIAEHLRGRLRDVTYEIITAGRELGPVTVAVIARDPQVFVDALNVEGVAEIVQVIVEAAEFECDVYQRAVAELITKRQPKVTLIGFTVNSMGYAPALAARLGLGFASDVHNLSLENGLVVATRSFYDSKVSAELEFPGARGVLLLLRPTVWPAAGGPGSAVVTESSSPAGPSRSRHLTFEEPESGDIDISQAALLLSIGRGVGSREGVKRFEELAAKMGATLAASRPIIDAGWLPASRQVGQSGKTVKPGVYLAFGISGAIQHLAGITAAGTILAVNTDPDAPIFGTAHYGAIADMFDIAEELEKL